MPSFAKKRISLLIVALLFLSTTPFCEAKETKQTQPQNKVTPKEVKPGFSIGNRVSRSIQKWTGINLVTQLISGQVVKYVIKKQVGGKVKVKVKTFSLTDLIAGKVKDLEISLEDSVLEGVPISKLKFDTKMPPWFSYKKKNRSYLNNPVAIDVITSISQAEVSKALADEKILASMRGLKLDLPGLGEQQLDILDPNVSIEKDLIVIKGTLITRGGAPETGVPIVIRGNPELVNGQRIFITNLKVDADCIIEPEKFAKFVGDLINPIVDFGRYDTTTHAFRLSYLKVEKNMVSGRGELILVPPAKPKKVAAEQSK